ncbi:MAG: cytochrome P450, partial [Myxococcales bacterium]|nr:cytochrome P450 [Myxococcales bacterium]
MPNVDVAYLDAPSWDAEMRERLRWLRENDPVHWSEPDQLWLVSKFEDVVSVSKDQGTYTSAEGVRPGNPAKLSLIDEGEPRHGELRALINKGFTPRMVKKWETAFRKITTDSLDEIAKLGECDFVDAISVPLPLLLIAEMIGIRKEDRERFHHWSDAMIAGDGNFHRPEIVAAAGQAFMEYTTYCKDIIEERRKNPQDDLLSILISAEDGGILGSIENKEDVPAIDNDRAANELSMFCVLLLVAGNETTRNAISGGMELLIENPGEREKLLANPELLKSAVEEMVRLVSPVHSFARTATRTTELRGKTIEEGQKVLLLYPSANRDADEYEEPDVFRVDRNPHHVGFGIGPHFCLGANLARMEMRVAFEQLLARLPDMEYADDEGPVLKPS